MCTVRLLADDLTGALDTAAEFVGLCGPFQVGWADALPAKMPRSFAIDCGTREQKRTEALESVGALAPLLLDATIAYKKIDSMLRGHWAAELAACFTRDGWGHCVVAPAFPYQGRRTRDGKQFARTADGSWRAISGDLAAALQAEELPAARASPGQPLAQPVTVFDAETDEDLDRIVSACLAVPGPVLWCGTGGLARALARDQQTQLCSALKGPVLGLFGSDQPATAAQLAQCAGHWIRLAQDWDDVRAIERRLRETGVALVSLVLPAGISRRAAAAQIAERFGRLVASITRPATLIVAGGETLKTLCRSLGAESLLVTGQVAHGVPRSILRGGVWDGVEVVSKSGAFGPPTLWRDLLIENGLMRERTDA